MNDMYPHGMQQQQQQQQHHKLGGRSASGLEELIMGCTSTDIKEVSHTQLVDSEIHACTLFLIVPTTEREKVGQE